MKFIIEEGETLQNLAIKAKANNIPFAYYPSYGGTNKTRIIKGVVVGNVKIWFPKKNRTVHAELNLPEIRIMKLKKMIMYNNEEAFFLIE